MDRFSKLHPAMQFLFYVVSLGLVLTVNNPIFSAISLVCAILYGFKTKGKAILKTIGFLVVIIAVVSVFNMLFAHYGEDVLFAVRETEFTLEALFYGFNQGMVLSATIMWFSGLSKTIDSERVIYLFRFTPRIALMFSMVLGFIPRFTKKLEDIRDAKAGLNGGEKSKNRLKDGIENLSALISYSLEGSIVTANSMEARGYNPKAVRAGRYKMTKSDIALIIGIIAVSVYIFIQMITKNLQFIFEPTIYINNLDALAVILFAALELIPTVTDVVEDVLWKLSNAKS